MTVTSGQKTASLFSRLNPIPGFPDYTGPYKVGTIDVEIPVTKLSRVSDGHNGPVSIHTVLFRVFYPAVPDARGKRITWLPSPQRLHVGAYAQFLGAGSTLASFLSFLPRHLHFASIPVHKNAALLRPDAEETGPRWPTVVFSHGLGGNRNTYSHLAGSLASHGVVVFCPEHRDGSAPVTLIRVPQDKPRTPLFSSPTVVECKYSRIPHKSDPHTWGVRNQQMRVRLWELGLVFDALSRIDKGDQEVVSANMNTNTPQDAILQFADQLDVQEPGRVIFAGHSFGAATVVQLVKSTYYADHPEVAKMAEPLFQPANNSYVRKQITEKNPLILLDMWCFPLVSAAAASLYDLPLPAYDDIPSAPGGDAILAVESQHFFKWRDHLHAKARILSPDPTQRIVTSSAFERSNGTRLSEPNFFYVESSAHLSQSDFGVLFPWLTKRVFGAENPERCLRLNLRAQLQLLRNNGYRVASTWNGDMVDDTASEKQKLAEDDAVDLEDGVMDDKLIFDRGNDGQGPIDAWKWVDIVGLGEHASPGEIELYGSARTDSEERQRVEEDEREMEGEMEPGLNDSTAEVVKKEAAAAAGAAGTESWEPPK